MVKHEQNIMGMITDGIGSISRILAANIFPPIAEGADMVMKNIEERILRIETRILRKLSSLIVIGVGIMFLLFALLFFLTEVLHWNNTMALFAIGITLLISGLLLKVAEPDR